MHGQSKYNNKATLELLKEVAGTTQVITRKDLMISMTGHVLKESGPELNHFNSALSNLKTRILHKHNVNLIKKDNETYKVNYIKVGEINTEKKPKPAKKDIVKNTALEALEKDNQKLFLEKEELGKQCEILRQQCEILLAKEKEYKNIIQSFYSLVMN